MTKDPETQTTWEKTDAEGMEKAGPDASFKISFRQGTTLEDERRGSWANKRVYKADTDGELMAVSDLNPDSLAKLEIEMTLTGTNLQFPNGDDLQFTADTPPKIKSPIQFSRWWGILPTSLARMIYQCCLEVNPDWDPKSGRSIY